jgi:hypothetical protein
MADQYRRQYEDELRREGRRGWAERAGEEVRSWFGDDDARARRGNDERDDRYPYGGDRDRGWRDQGDGTYERGADRWRGTDRGSERRYLGGRDYERERYGAASRGQGERGDDRGWRSEGDDWDSHFTYGRREAPERQHEWDDRRQSGRYGGGGFSGSGYRGALPGGAAGGYGPGGYGPGGQRGGTSAGGRWQGGAREYEDYSGRGPRDYRRSDERIREEISDRLTDDYRVDASDITIQVKDGEVTLSGTVSTRDQKRRAEDLAETISGVRDVTNNIRVNRNMPAGLGLTQPVTTPVGIENETTAGDRQQPAASSGRRPGVSSS